MRADIERIARELVNQLESDLMEFGGDYDPSDRNAAERERVARVEAIWGAEMLRKEAWLTAIEHAAKGLRTLEGN